ncbi:MAG: nucleoside hydrolase [Luteolibacter sp.]
MNPCVLPFAFPAVIFGLLVSGLTPPASAAPEKIRVILDSDANNEVDDQHAIAYLLFSGGAFDVEGITVNRTRNGGGLDQHVAEARRVVRLCGEESVIPVLPGADKAFNDIKEQLDRPNFDGAAAVNFIIERARATDDRRLVLLPIGKLTTTALALAKDPTIASKLRIVWLGSNYPEPGEYNQDDDEPALNYILNTGVDFEIALVRAGKPSGTAAVRATQEEIQRIMPGAGPRIDPPVAGRHGDQFTCFGDYSVSLFKNVKLNGDPPARSLYDMAAVAIVKNGTWASPRTIPAPILKDGRWSERPDNPRKIVIWENFNRNSIMADFYQQMKNPQPAQTGRPAR